MDRNKRGLAQLGDLGQLIDKHVGKHVDSPVVDQLRAKLDEWNDPAARLERRKRWTSRMLTFWIVLVLIFALVAGVGFAGLAGVNATITTLGAAAATIFAIMTGAMAVRAGVRLRRLNRTPVPAGPVQLPPRDSMAREPMERLGEAERTFADLLRQLDGQEKGGGTIPAYAVQDARNTAEDAATALRDLAERIQSVERASESAPARERAALGESVRTLRGQLDSGLEGYGELVAAAGRAVAESSDHLETHQRQLTDATDHLAGLAIAARELSTHNRH